jgi:exodeoxyribonuclease VII small subunit
MERIVTPKRKSAELTPNQPSFEKALERLEKIVEQMESAELPLEEVLKRYEEGTELVKFCQQKLEEAEKKIEILAKKKDGSPQLKKFQVEDEEQASETRPKASPGDEGKEGKLF